MAQMPALRAWGEVAVNAKRMVVALTVLLVLGAVVVGCTDSDVQTGTYVGWDASFEGDGTPAT